MEDDDGDETGGERDGGSPERHESPSGEGYS